MTSSIPILLDVDTGADDALALLNQTVEVLVTADVQLLESREELGQVGCSIVIEQC